MSLPAALYLIPVTLGDTPLEQVLPAYNREIILQITHFVVEEVRTARRFLKSVEKSIDIDSLSFYPMGKHAEAARFSQYLDPLRPAVADPGADVVALAQREGLPVVPLVGPSSILLAVMGSGFNGQSFAFNGYLPIDPAARAKELKKLEARSASEKQTQLFIETPYRNAKLIAELLSALRPSTGLCIAAGLTTENQFLCTKTVEQWRRASLPNLSKTPTIFAIYAG